MIISCILTLMHISNLCRCFLIRLPLAQIIAVSIETAFQNGSIAFILLQLTLEDPKNDIATIAPIAQIMLTGIIIN